MKKSITGKIDPNVNLDNLKSELNNKFGLENIGFFGESKLTEEDKRKGLNPIIKTFDSDEISESNREYLSNYNLNVVIA